MLEKDTMLSVESITKDFERTRVLSGVSISLKDGEFLTFLGPSGCGKTTMLRIIAGFEVPDGGRIVLDGIDITGVRPYRRPIGMVFQNLALFPHLTVSENVAFGFRVQRMPALEIQKRVANGLDLVGMSGHGQRAVHQLSGGQRQRIALARSLVTEPRILLLDEPLGALDLKLRRQLQVELKLLQRRTGTSFVFVTHDQEEAMSMSDRIVVFNRGKVEQIGTPQEVYLKPTSRFVADFVGESNLFSGTFDGNIYIPELDMHLAGRDDLVKGNIWVSVRPENLNLVACQSAGRQECLAYISSVEFGGINLRIHAALANSGRKLHRSVLCRMLLSISRALQCDWRSRALPVKMKSDVVDTKKAMSGLIGVKNKISVQILSVPQFIIIGFFLYGLISVAHSSFVQNGEFSVGLYADLLTSPMYQVVMKRTVYIAIICTVLCVLLGYPIAYLIARSRKTEFLLFLLITPWLVSVVVRSFGWILLLGRNGFVNGILIALGITDTPYRLVYNLTGTVIGLVHILLPMMVLIMLSVLAKLDRGLEEASSSLGSGPFGTFLRVTLPLSMPGIYIGSILTFLSCMGAVLTPMLLGSFQENMMGTQIYQEIFLLFSYQRAAAFAVILLSVSFVLVAPLVILDARSRRRGG